MTGHRPTERTFGVSVGTVALCVGALASWRRHPTAGVALLIAGALLSTLGRLAPSALRIPNRIWWRFAQALGWVNARILLTVFFAVVLTPVGVLLRLLGRSPLRPLRADSNWGAYPARGSRHYERMF